MPTAVAPNLTSDFFGAFKEFRHPGVRQGLHRQALTSAAYIAEQRHRATFIVMFLTTMLAFCMVDMFDTLGTLYGACSAGNMLDQGRQRSQHGPGHAG